MMIEFIKNVIDFCLHIDKNLGDMIHNYGAFVYIILFIVVFCETGLVVIPFLPGDSLAFIAGAFAAKGDLNIILVLTVFTLAAILGDFVNYSIGRKIGSNISQSGKNRFIKPEYIEKTQQFFDKHGGKTIIIARFMPIIRTFAPFVAGAGRMNYSKFIIYNVTGGVMWAFLLSFAGFFFGNLPVVQDNLSLVIYGIIVVSLMPPVITSIISKIKKSKA
jgi:membrane-associated protein